MRNYVHELFRAARHAMLAITVAVVPALSPSTAAAQDAAVGKITGRIVDATTGQPIPAAQIQVVGTQFGTQSGVDGRYVLLRVPAGTITLQVRRIGYGAKTITGLMLAANGAIEQDISLKSAELQLAAVTTTANKEKGSVNDALNAQKNATNAVNSITAEQIAKSPDSDAAQAAQRVSGVTVQDGKYLQVRGLGERYTTASLNGARIPSPEPERKVVPLDLFPAGLLQEVTTTKTFTPDQPGDFAGANVNIRTREFPARRQVTYSAGTCPSRRAPAVSWWASRCRTAGCPRPSRARISSATSRSRSTTRWRCSSATCGTRRHARVASTGRLARPPAATPSSASVSATY
jgi:hypothetical protein